MNPSIRHNSWTSLSYKLLHSTAKSDLLLIKSNDLEDIEFIKPECQRAVDTEQVNTIFSFQEKHFKSHNCFFFTNPITIAEFENKKYIIDGQHRLKCICLLNHKYHPFDVLVSILHIENKKEIDEKYIAINQNKPVPLPDNINDWKKFTRHIDEYMQSKYSCYFSKSERPQLPNFNKEKMLKYINDHNIPEKINYNYTLFLEELEKLNLFYQETYSSTLNNFKINVSHALKKF